MTTPFAAPARIIRLVVHGAVGLTAVTGGAVMVVGALTGAAPAALRLPDAYLEGSPFSSYLVPGLVLALVVGGTHAGAFLLELGRSGWGRPAGAVAGFGLQIWIFVQMAVIPFSPLQAAYEVAALLELGALLVELGLLAGSRARSFRRSAHSLAS